MSVYVDKAIWPKDGKLWCHMIANDLDELHAFARRLGLKREWCQMSRGVPHYDLTASKRLEAIRRGAIHNPKMVAALAKWYRQGRKVPA